MKKIFKDLNRSNQAVIMNDCALTDFIIMSAEVTMLFLEI